MPMLHLDDPIVPAETVTEAPAAAIPTPTRCWCSVRAPPGMPKAVRHTHGAFAAAVGHWRDALRLTDG